MDRIADSGSADMGSNPFGNTKSTPGVLFSFKVGLTWLLEKKSRLCYTD
jgi:hypothetical protein